MYKIIFYTAIASLIILFASCADENIDLVNPPSQVSTIYTRFINFASDKKARTLHFGDAGKTLPIAYGQCSEATNPPLDSAIMKVGLGDAIEYTSINKKKFSREVIYSFVALPSKNGAKEYKAVDTIVTFVTSKNIMDDDQKSYIKMMNANPDTTKRYSMRFGCPNGVAIGGEVSYRGITKMTSIRSGTSALSIIKKVLSEETVIGLYELKDLAPKSQYTLIVVADENGNEEVYALNELDKTVEAKKLAKVVSERFAEMRTLNFSTAKISVSKDKVNITGGEIDAKNTGDYIKISACSSSKSDVLFTNIGSQFASKISYPLEVLSKYSLVVLDSAERKAGQTILLEPVTDVNPEDLKTKAVIRVVHGAAYAKGLTLTVGARNDLSVQNTDKKEYKYISGEELASKLEFSDVSHRVLVPAGKLPLTLFTASEPAELLEFAMSEVQAGKEYLIVITEDTGNYKLNIVESTETNSKLSSLEAGGFVQVVNGLVSRTKAKVSISDLVQPSDIFFGTSLGTVLSVGPHTVTMDGKTHNLSINAQKRYMLIATEKNGTVFLEDEKPSIITDPSKAYIRSVNASSDIEKINIQYKEDSKAPLFKDLEFGKYSARTTQKGSKKNSYYFINSKNNEIIKRIDDIVLPERKMFLFVLFGNKTKGYSVSILQEF